jgi:sulfatase modifying factor 1
MGGNVWQWTNTTYRPYPGSNEPFRIDESAKVIRGGSFMYDDGGIEHMTVSFRASNTTETSNFNIGFRCAR